MTKEERAREHAVGALNAMYPKTRQTLDKLADSYYDLFINGWDDCFSIKDKEIEELKEKTKILITALEIIAESNPISMELDEVEELANSALTSFRNYETE